MNSEFDHIKPFRTSSGKLVVPRRFVKVAGQSQASDRSLTCFKDRRTSEQQTAIRIARAKFVLPLELSAYDPNLWGWGTCGISDKKTMKLDPAALPPPSPICEALCTSPPRSDMYSYYCRINSDNATSPATVFSDSPSPNTANPF